MNKRRSAVLSNAECSHWLIAILGMYLASTRTAQEDTCASQMESCKPQKSAIRVSLIAFLLANSIQGSMPSSIVSLPNYGAPQDFCSSTVCYGFDWFIKPTCLELNRLAQFKACHTGPAPCASCDPVLYRSFRWTWYMCIFLELIIPRLLGWLCYRAVGRCKEFFWTALSLSPLSSLSQSCLEFDWCKTALKIQWQQVFFGARKLISTPKRSNLPQGSILGPDAFMCTS